MFSVEHRHGFPFDSVSDVPRKQNVLFCIFHSIAIFSPLLTPASPVVKIPLLNSQTRILGLSNMLGDMEVS